MTDGRLPLPDEFLPKAQRYMRALRRGVLSYWYATLEDTEAAAIEAATATWYVNVLDESVFEKAFEEQYQRLRAKDRLGRVVMGLELIRNCETHAPVVFGGLLVDTHWYGVPRSTGAFTVRRVFAWADADALPETYRDVSSAATSAQRRARAEAQDGYRKDVEGRHVIETLFDAMAFFHSLDARLVGPPAPSLRWSFAEIPDTDPEVADPTSWYLARPLGLDAFELFLPSLACRDSERRMARWPPADRTLDARARQARKGLPAAPAREVLHVLMDDGQVVGYSGFTPEPHGGLSSWVERRSQVWQDVRKGYRYFVVHEDVEIDLQGAAHERVCAPLPDGRDLLADLPEPEPAFDIGRLRMLEQHDDLYLQMRRDGRCSCTQCCTRCSEDLLAD